MAVADLDLAQLRALTAVIAEGSLDAAARVLHVTPSAVSQRLRALEVTTGRVLVVRGRPARVTASGEVLLRLARQVDLLATDAAAELGGPGSDAADPDARPPALPIAVNADSLATWVLPALAPLAGSLCLDLRREDQERTSTLLRDGSVVAAITTDAAAVPGCSSTPLGAMRYRAAASAAFARRWFPRGVRSEVALAAASVVVFDRDDDLQDAHLRTRAPGARPPRHHVPSSADFLTAVRLGMGWGMLPILQADDLLASGELVDLDPSAAVDVTLHWQRWRLRSPGLDAVDAAVRAAAAQHLEPARRPEPARRTGSARRTDAEKG